MNTIDIVFLSGIPLAIIPSWLLMRNENFDDIPSLKYMLTFLLSLSGWFVIIIAIFCFFEKQKQIRELMTIHFSEAREMARRFKELQLKEDFKMPEDEAFIKSVKYMELMYGDWWFSRGTSSENEDKFKADQIKWKIEEYLSKKEATHMFPHIY